MTSVALYKQDGSKNGSVKLNDDIFGIKPNNNVEFDAVLMQRASQRQGTADTKSRGERRGGGKKPWRQKGTGRARQGSIRDPQWRKGGIVFGPTPRSYNYHLPKKVTKLATKSALSDKVAAGDLYVVDSLKFNAPKTKKMSQLLAGLKDSSKTLLVLESGNHKAALAARNLPNVMTITGKGINTLDVMDHRKVVMTKAALAEVEEVLA
ncbi:50S ribosomal protein L4 [Acetilactobacillus jinshanensis]|uniref:Large ribosomal subunit protein uL4 n=1 Tax=Acetilactobacillus jinshanensis TaxID=1720083 RepID=A0A4P6ZJM6_9LACO|nr:50S ribosomal protein L4 [Acetilactobacillus jinshanensis]QBP17824.1 50S ribosomal protein L4 [Acetilactobacillus jinshanensis]URL60686.1 50S ribosomal protein L4 [uncultured bacterium]